MSFSKRDVEFRSSYRRPIVEQGGSLTRQGSDFSSSRVHQSHEKQQTSSHSGGSLRHAIECKMDDYDCAWEHIECSLKAQGKLSDGRVEPTQPLAEPIAPPQKSTKSKKKKCVIS